jgi:2-oxo-4-hydroxy-4-carboxy-5-ureidoimidazoline decarboxylase
MVAAAAAITDEELEQALARHPRIGERADAAKHDATHSTREQAGVDASDAELARRLAEGNRAYEERFGRVFLTCATGKDGPTMLAELQRRLHNEPAIELAIAIEEQKKITRLRLEKWLRS